MKDKNLVWKKFTFCKKKGGGGFYFLSPTLLAEGNILYVRKCHKVFRNTQDQELKESFQGTSGLKDNGVNLFRIIRASYTWLHSMFWSLYIIINILFSLNIKSRPFSRGIGSKLNQDQGPSPSSHSMSWWAKASTGDCVHMACFGFCTQQQLQTRLQAVQIYCWLKMCNHFLNESLNIITASIVFHRYSTHLTAV